MKNFNRLTKLLLSILVAVFAFLPYGCAKNEITISLYVPDGAPLISARAFFADNECADGYSIDANLVTGAQIAPLVSAKTPDIAIAPMPVCATSYALTNGEYVFAGTAVFGLNHIVTNLDAAPDTLSGLVGEVIYSFQKQGTPSQTLRAVLTAHSIPYKEFTEDDKIVAADKVNIEYLPSPADVRNAMTGPNKASYRYGLLAEPMATSVVNSGALKRAFDLQNLWKDKHGGVSYPQVGVIVRKSLIEKDSELVNKLTAVFTANSEYVFANALDTAAYLKDELDSAELPAKDVIAAFINSDKGAEAFSFVSGAGQKDNINAYLSAIGVALPNDLFYI